MDRSYIGRVVTHHWATADDARLRLFGEAIGDADTHRTDDGRMTVPPTFLFCLEMERPDPYDWYAAAGLELPKILHGEQSFRYLMPCHAGDVLRFEARVEDIYEKKGGALEFLVKRTQVENQLGQAVAELRTVIVQRHG